MKQISKQISARFGKFTTLICDWMGNFWSFILAILFILAWFVTGPLFHFSDTWQLVINTGTTIITFLMVFLIQHTQNRDIKILNLKLNELIKSHKGANNHSIDLNSLSDEALKQLEIEYLRIRELQTGS